MELWYQEICGKMNRTFNLSFQIQIVFYCITEAEPQSSPIHKQLNSHISAVCNKSKETKTSMKETKWLRNR